MDSAIIIGVVVAFLIAADLLREIDTLLKSNKENK